MCDPFVFIFPTCGKWPLLPLLFKSQKMFIPRVTSVWCVHSLEKHSYKFTFCAYTSFMCINTLFEEVRHYLFILLAWDPSHRQVLLFICHWQMQIGQHTCLSHCGSTVFHVCSLNTYFIIPLQQHTKWWVVFHLINQAMYVHFLLWMGREGLL